MKVVKNLSVRFILCMFLLLGAFDLNAASHTQVDTRSDIEASQPRLVEIVGTSVADWDSELLTQLYLLVIGEAEDWLDRSISLLPGGEHNSEERSLNGRGIGNLPEPAPRMYEDLSINVLVVGHETFPKAWPQVGANPNYKDGEPELPETKGSTNDETKGSTNDEGEEGEAEEGESSPPSAGNGPEEEPVRGTIDCGC